MSKKDKENGVGSTTPTPEPVQELIPEPAKAEPAKLTPEQILAKIAEVSAKGDIAEVVRLGNLLKKEKKAIEDAENAKLLKEAEELAGKREELAKELHTAVITNCAGLLTKLKDVKASGFTFKLDTVDPDGGKVQYKAVELAVPKPKTKKSGGGRTGGSGVSTKDSTGMSLSELIDQYATDEEKAAIQEAYDTAEKSPASAKWSAQTKVKAEILKRNPELVK